MILTPDEERLKQQALALARAEKKAIAKRLTDKSLYPPEKDPVALFMAGSPGAGKTETAEAMLEEVSNSVILVDPDRYRIFFEGYDGSNAWLFQPAVSVIVEKVIDLAFKNNQSFILDGTLTNYDKAKSNIERCLNKGRMVQIMYVYQDPCLAWKFVVAREASEGRRINWADFVDQYFKARTVVNRLKKELGSRVSVDLIIKNLDNSMRSYRMNVDVIDRYVPEKFSRESLEAALNPEQPL